MYCTLTGLNVWPSEHWRTICKAKKALAGAKQADFLLPNTATNKSPTSLYNWIEGIYQSVQLWQNVIFNIRHMKMFYDLWIFSRSDKKVIQQNIRPYYMHIYENKLRLWINILPKMILLFYRTHVYLAIFYLPSLILWWSKKLITSAHKLVGHRSKWSRSIPSYSIRSLFSGRRRFSARDGIAERTK